MATMTPEDEVEILHDGAIASAEVNFGRIVPVLFLNAEQRPDITRLIDAHREIGVGDVTSMFAISSDRSSLVILLLAFERPIETKILLRFPLEKWALVVDAMVKSRCVNLQAMRPGEAPDWTDSKGRVTIDLHVEGFEEEWEKAYRNVAKERLKGNGLNRGQLTGLAEEMVTESRKLSHLRMPPN